MFTRKRQIAPGVVVLQRDTPKTACLSYGKKESFRLYMSYLLGKRGKSDLKNYLNQEYRSLVSESPLRIRKN